MASTISFAHYEVLTREDGSMHELGRGTMGITYKGFDTRLRCSVALKVINPARLGNEAARKRFVGEARKAARLKHRNIASVFHLREEGENCFYAMEFIDGETLDARLKREGPLPPALALRITAQVARALNEAQKYQIVHRDIKPSNLMLVSEDDEVVVKVIDFGLAKFGAGEGETVAPTMSGSFQTQGGICGSVAFASPEQLDPDLLHGEEIDVRADIYALGCTLWTMLSGHAPFSGTAVQVISQKLFKPPPFEKLQHLPEPVLKLLARMLEKDRTRRQQAPSELRREIDRCVTLLGHAPGALPRRRRETDASTATNVHSTTPPEVAKAETVAKLPGVEATSLPPPPRSPSAVEVMKAAATPAPAPVSEIPASRGKPRYNSAGIAALLAIGAVACFLLVRPDHGFLARLRGARPHSAPVHAAGGDAPGTVKQAEALESQQRWSEALDTWRHIRIAYPVFTPGKSGVGQFLVRLRNHLAASPDEFEQVRGGIEELSRNGELGAKMILADELVRVARAREAEGKWTEALAAWHFLAEEYPESDVAKEGYGLCLARLRADLTARPPEALESLRDVITAASRDGNVTAKMILADQLQRIASGFEAKQRRREALAAWLRLAEEYPELPTGRARLSLLLDRAGWAGSLSAAEFKTMRREFTKAAQLDIPPAQFLLGQYLRDREPAAGFAWYCAAASHGEPLAMRQAGLMLSEGRGVAMDMRKAAYYFAAAAERRETTAMVKLARCFLTGAGVLRDPERAVEWLRKASDLGDTHAKNVLGDWYHKGTGVRERDDNEAFRLFSEAARLGDAEGIGNLGVLYMTDDCVTPKNPKAFRHDANAAYEKFREASAKGDKASMCYLAYCLENGLGHSRDAEGAKSWYRKAVEKFRDSISTEDTTGMYQFALCLENGFGCVKDPEAARSWYRKAAEAGHQEALQWCERNGVAFHQPGAAAR